jgi:hypothetical protein
MILTGLIVSLVLNAIALSVIVWADKEMVSMRMRLSATKTEIKRLNLRVETQQARLALRGL